MLNSKFYLYKIEWLDLVFDDRNKEYGAYDLRKHYADNLTRAMAIAFFGVIVLFIAHSIFFKPRQIEITRVIPNIIIPPPTVKPPVVAPPPPPAIQHPHVQVSTVKYPTPVATADNLAVNPPTIDEVKTAAIGTQNSKGKDDGANIDLPETPAGDGGIGKVTEDNTPKSIDVIEVVPEPFGGSAAWSKFLQKNIRYPGQAVEENKQGRVWVSFIVEKDGRLSNFVVERGAGYGMDEEALRVLKLAPAWKPGIQNGHPVRVKYNIPINFQLSSD